MPSPRPRSIALCLGAAAALIACGNAVAQPGEPRCPVPAAAAGGPSNAHSRFVEANLNPPVVQPGARPHSLAERMRAYNVPGISVAVIHRGKLAWARGWGLRDTASCAPVTPDTAFQAASISKLATAVIALRLVEQGKLGLDRDINRFLRSWQLPRDPERAPDGVTLRQLLSHTAGLGIHGFAGYTPDADLPTPAQILDGTPPANSGAVRSTQPAGGQWTYSGGGYVLTQLALSDVSGTPFEMLAQRELFDPLGMTRSAYAQPPSATILADIASAHAGGVPIPGRFHVYPELAAAGLWTNAADLARLLIDVQAAAAGGEGHRLSPAMARAMLTPVMGNWGMGAALYSNGARRFGHDGLNEGFQSSMIAYVDGGDGIVVLANSGQSRRLIDEIVRAIATDYGWTDIAAPAVAAKMLTHAQLERVAGTFAGGGLSVVLEARAEGLFADTGGPHAERLVALSATRFFSDATGIVAEFAPDYSSFDIVEGGPPIKLVRSKP
ncbi:serine hydrolase domain-containing protein [Sphingomonas sp. DG1-23]|uniref:serine hydrolase domain-containing protein n=1 Tax=Sphingomonas sp. DG1-23 TaxID=3068316 RepID=UPI00273D719B|nr:serine hydrolase domain-containing protein [Sphingomonas sp. DG1-23]MDP5280254.1 serine hydrolase domain-containing protein [Sphingomonas sp. DG1-23]